jgi:hypothetical protein
VNPNLEFFLEEVVRGIDPTSSGIGRVVIEPDYDAGEIGADAQPLRDQLLEIIRSPTTDAPDGTEIKIPPAAALVRKYIRRITLYRDRLPGDWIEVTPPGSWI